MIYRSDETKSESIFLSIYQAKRLGKSILRSGLGVMLDDVLAGIAGGLLSALILMGIGKLF